MAEPLSFDELNRLNGEDQQSPVYSTRTQRSIPFRQYFQPMLLSVAEMTIRIALAEEIDDLVYGWLAIWDTYKSMGIVADIQYLTNYLATRLVDIFVKYDDDDTFVGTYALTLAQELTRSTEASSARGGTYWNSHDRSQYIAENEANTVRNHNEYSSARAVGMTRKQWVGMKDEKERPTHWVVNDVIIPIDELFSVGNAHLAYPKDVIIGDGAAHPEEIINCRCSVTYLS